MGTLRRRVGARAAGERCREEVGTGLNLQNQVAMRGRREA